MIQMGYHGGLNQHSISTGGEKWLDIWYFMKTEPTRFPDMREREKSRVSPEFWASATGRVELPSTS